MKLTILGAAGDVGRRIVTEALARGHEVTGVVRSAAQFGQLPEGVHPRAADIARSQEVALAAAGQDALISAVRPPDGQEDSLVALTRSVLEGAHAAGVRVLLVGGAARLRVPGHDGATVLTAPDFLPAAVVAIARACQAQYELCLEEHRADWSYLSPPGLLQPGARTGRYRLGTDTLLVDAGGVSHISLEDFAVAMLDEAERARHVRRAFTVGY